MEKIRFIKVEIYIDLGCIMGHFSLICIHQNLSMLIQNTVVESY